MDRFKNVSELALYLKDRDSKKENDKVNLTLLYAFNATGKTMLTTEFTKDGDGKSLCFNAFIEDLFKWDNDDLTLLVDNNSWIIKTIIQQDLENQVIDAFRDIIDAKIEPNFNLKEGKITFDYVSGDDSSENKIKISKGEESIFKWTIFYVILEVAIESLVSEPDDRTTSNFNDLEYAIIDDPISSIDDTKIIKMAMKLVGLLRVYQNNHHKLNFLITTHHPLFYNVLYNEFNGRKGNAQYNFNSSIMSKDNNIIQIENKGDSPFSYHLFIKKEIEKAIKADDLKKYHFNLFRTLVEKTSTFFGYKEWSECIKSDSKDVFVRTINAYSHGKLTDLEYVELSESDKEMFAENFKRFCQEFNWRSDDE